MNQTLYRSLLALEQKLLDPAVRASRHAVEPLLADEFRETGRSGKVYSKAEILDLLAQKDHTAPIAMDGFAATLLGPEAALATYSAEVEGKRSHHSSVWVFRRGRWQMLHHQGTPAA